MDTARIAHPAHLDTRELRALDLYRTRSGEIEHLAGEVFLVPSSDGRRVYRVDYANETCSCPDAEFHPDLNCKHLLAVAIKHAKRRSKTGVCCECGRRARRRDLYEIGDDHLTYFEGDLLCEACATRAGVR